MMPTIMHNNLERIAAGKLQPGELEAHNAEWHSHSWSWLPTTEQRIAFKRGGPQALTEYDYRMPMRAEWRKVEPSALGIDGPEVLALTMTGRWWLAVVRMWRAA